MTLYRKIRNKLIITIRQFIFNLNDRFPLAGYPLVTGWKVLCNLKFIIRKETLKLITRLSYSTDKLNLEKICWVDPKKIEYCLVNPGEKFGIWQNYGRILDGDWDQNKSLEFENSDVYRAFKQRFNEGKCWKETEFYQRVLNQILQGTRKWGCKNKEDFDTRLSKIEALYHQIKKNGYKSKEELYSMEGWLGKLERPSQLLDEVCCAIGRRGELFLIEGRHRLSIAKLLNLPEIPIKIIARHKKWMDFRKELIFFAKNYQKGELYQPLIHPDLQDIPAKRWGDNRFQIIRDNLSIAGGTLLDIGANLGHFCYKFEDEGFDCYALEENRMCIYFMKEIKEMENRKFKIIPENLFEYKKKKEITFDVVLALSVFHHFLERKDTYLNLIKLLKRLKVKELFFESHLPTEFSNRTFYKNYTPEQFVNFIIRNSYWLNKSKFIGRSERGRPLYKLTP